MVDGVWAVDPQGIRTLQIGYDRLFATGDRTWKDYEVEADIRLMKGKSVGLITRYVNKANHLVCVFDDRSVRIEQRLNDEIQTLAKARNESDLTSSSLHLD